MDAIETLLSTKHALAYLEAHHGLRYTVSTFHQYCHSGRGPRHRKCGRLQFLPSDLDAWVAERVARSAARREQRRAAIERARKRRSGSVVVTLQVSRRLHDAMKTMGWDLTKAEPLFRNWVATP